MHRRACQEELGGNGRLHRRGHRQPSLLDEERQRREYQRVVRPRDLHPEEGRAEPDSEQQKEKRHGDQPGVELRGGQPAGG